MDPSAVRLQHPNLPLLLLRGRERLLSYFRPILNAHGLTEQQWRILRALLETPLEPCQICDLCCISSPSLVGVLARMQQLGLVNKSAVAGDQRRLLVSPTPRARRLAASIIPEIEGAYREIEKRIGKPLLNQIRNTLEQALTALEPQIPAQVQSQPQPPAATARGQRKSGRSTRASAL